MAVDGSGFSFHGCHWVFLFLTWKVVAVDGWKTMGVGGFHLLEWDPGLGKAGSGWRTARGWGGAGTKKPGGTSPG